MEKQVKYYTIVADFGADGTSTFMISEDKAIAEETFKQLTHLRKNQQLKHRIVLKNS